MKLLSFGTLPKYFALLIITPLFDVAYLVYKFHFFEDNGEITDSRHIFYDLFFTFFGKLLSLFFCIYSYYRQINKDKAESKQISNTKSYYKKKFESQRKKQFTLSMLVYCFINCLVEIAFSFTYGVLEMKTSFRFQEINIIKLVGVLLISKLIFDYPLYSHHNLSIGIIVIGELLIYISDVPKFSDIYLCISSVFFACSVISHKYMIEYIFISPYSILALEGLFGIILSLLFLIIIKYIPCQALNLQCVNGFDYYDSIDYFYLMFSKSKHVLRNVLFYYLFLVFEGLAKNIGYILINKTYNPTHRVITETLGYLLVSIERLIDQQINKEILRL